IQTAEYVRTSTTQQYVRRRQAKAARHGGIMSKTRTVANLWAERLASYGVKRFFGVPGGDCSLDIIQAAADHGIDFILPPTEPAATGSSKPRCRRRQARSISRCAARRSGR